MFLTATNLVHYLLNRGLVTAEEIVRGPFQIQEIGRRNRNFVVRRGDAPGMFVKQVPIVADETIASVFREAAVYQLAEHDRNFQSLQGLLPKLYDYDPKIHCMVAELLPPAEGYTQLHMRLNGFPEFPATLLGNALGRVHAAADTMLSVHDRTVAFPRIAPWVLTIAQNAESVIGNKSEGIRQMTDMLRQNQLLVGGLDALHKMWRNSALIHGDIKWDNFMVRHGVDGEDPHLYVVDWELADVGDPSWDLGCVFGAYLQHWIATMSADASTLDTTQLILAAPYKLESLWPAMRAFWSSYSSVRGFSPQQADDELNRATLFTAARLVLTGYEIAFQMPNVGRTNQLCMQLATAMMADPVEGRKQILGFNAASLHPPTPPSEPTPVQVESLNKPQSPETAA